MLWKRGSSNSFKRIESERTSLSTGDGSSFLRRETKRRGNEEAKKRRDEEKRRNEETKKERNEEKRRNEEVNRNVGNKKIFL